MRFRFIEDRRADYPVTVLCDVLGGLAGRGQSAPTYVITSAFAIDLVNWTQQCDAGFHLPLKRIAVAI